MVKLMRVDYRLIHGQVAVSWTNFLGVDSIVVANDEAAGNQLTLMTMKLAKPSGVDLIVCKTTVAAKELEKLRAKKVFLVCGNVKDAAVLAEQISDIPKICLGNVKSAEGKRKINEQIFLDGEEVGILQKLNQSGFAIECQTVPSAKILSWQDVQKIWNR